MRIVLSNRLEELAQALGERALIPQGGRRLIVIPSQAMKSWLQLFFAARSKKGIMGLEWSFLDQATRQVVQGRVLSKLEAALLIEKELPDVDRSALADRLAGMFRQYSLYGSEFMQRDLGEDWHWQQKIWDCVYGSGDHDGARLAGAIERCPFSEVHLFGIQDLSPSHRDFFFRLSEKVPVSGYFLSPCQAFWSDICSDGQAEWLQTSFENKGSSEAQLENLEELLQDRNWLLANNGRMGRALALWIEEQCQEIEERYVVPLESEVYAPLIDQQTPVEQSPPTLLRSVQADILLMRNADQVVDLDGQDRSIRIESAPTPMAEIEALRETILEFVEQGVYPGDIIVMAPKMGDYQPYIERVFKCRDEPIPFQLWDLSIAGSSAPVQALNRLLEVASGRWKSFEVMELLETPLFRHKQGWTADRLALIRDGVQAAGICWGWDAADRTRILKERGCLQEPQSDVGTWSYGFDRLLYGLSSTEGECTIPPTPQFELSDAVLLGEWIQVMQAIRESLAPLINQEHHSIEGWIDWIGSLMDDFFLPATSAEKVEWEELFEFLRKFRQAGAVLNQQSISYKSFIHHLEAQLSQKESVQYEGMRDAVQFCSLLPMRAIPAKVVCLIGMDGRAFPREDLFAGLNLLRTPHYPGYYPSRSDFDRYLFLESILSARNAVILSYVDQAVDGTPQTPSIVILEIQEYLDRQYSLGGAKPSERRKPKAINRSPSIPQRDFLRTSSPPSHPSPVVSLDQLIIASRNPARLYLREALGIRLPRAEWTELVDEEVFLTSPLHQSLLLRASLTTDPGAVWERAMARGEVPTGGFKTYSLHKFIEEAGLYRERLKGVQIQSVHLHPVYTEWSQISEHELGAPSPVVETPSGQSIQIIGKLDRVSSDGLIQLGKWDRQNLIRSLPELLVYKSLFAGNEGLVAKARYLKSDRSIDLGELPDLLGTFLEYALACQEKFSPLIPEWISPLLSKTEEFKTTPWTQLVNPAWGHIYQEELKWVGPADPEKIFSPWMETAQSLYQPVLNTFFKEKVR